MNRKNWKFLSLPEHIPPDVLAASGHLILAQLLVARGQDTAEKVKAFLNPDTYQPAPYSALPDLERTIERLLLAIDRGEQICVWGDFDVDGQTSTALLVSALKQVDGEVIYHIPNRRKESHGIKPAFLKPYLDEGIDVLLTCDTGSSAVEAVALACDAGVDVLITDHHDLPEVLPDAYALVNPKRLPPGHPLGSLPGVGVAYVLMAALYQRLDKSTALEPLLDLVALGIVADVAVIEQDTRYYLQRGLAVLRETSRPGLHALMDRARIDATFLIDQDIGFGIGPRLNALGRLDDANPAVPLLTSLDQDMTSMLADRLEDLNSQRQLLTRQIYEAALVQIEREPALNAYAVLVLSHPAWHPGVIGIVASRLVEMYGKPAILFQETSEGVARGSARSIEGYNITKAIRTQADYLHGYGGHPMAAGLSLDTAQMQHFRRGVSNAIIEQRQGEPPQLQLDIHLSLKLKDLTDTLVMNLEKLAPFGNGNPPINYLIQGVQVEKVDPIGKRNQHRKMWVSDREGGELAILWWNSAEEELPEGVFDVVVGVRPSYFRGERQLQVVYQDHRAGRESRPTTASRLMLLDWRDSTRVDYQIEQLLSQKTGVVIWQEPAGKASQSRDRLAQCEILVIRSLPPSQAVMHDVISSVHAKTIALCAEFPPLDTLELFLKRLAGIVQFSLMNYQGKVPLARLAGAMAHDPETVWQGLLTLQGMGIKAQKVGEEVILEKSATKTVNTIAQDQLLRRLAEAKAFRSMLARTPYPENFF